ncbi:MAG: tetratricopeptide repeat protein [Chloroflexi bacterium]|nr:tetratricopeptide repeat protein [Chloroflexota bacterium]
MDINPNALNFETNDDGLPPTMHPWEDPEAILRHAKRSHYSGDKTRAVTLYARVIELACNDARGWAGYAATTPNVDEAIVSWGYTLALAPDIKEARAELDTLVEERVQTSQLAPGENPALAVSFVALGRALAEAGQKPWAYHLLVRATQMDGQNDQAWMWRAGVTDDLAETVSCLEQSLKINPQNMRARAGLHWARTRLAAIPASRSAAERAAQWVEESQRALHDGDTDRAYELLKNASELDPQNALAWFWRGSVAVDVDEALACLEQALALDPKSEAAKDAVWWLRVRKLRERARAQARVIASSASASFPRVANAAPEPVPTAQPIPLWLAAVASVAIVIALIVMIVLIVR